jgi:hypothetical protein
MLGRSSRLISPLVSLPFLVSSARIPAAAQASFKCVVGCALLSLCSTVQAAAIPVQADFGRTAVQYQTSSQLHANMSSSQAAEMDAVVAADSKCLLVKVRYGMSLSMDILHPFPLPTYANGIALLPKHLLTHCSALFPCQSLAKLWSGCYIQPSIALIRSNAST